MDREAARAKREAREAAEARAARDLHDTLQKSRRMGLGIGGALFFGAGMHFLFNPAVGLSDTINLQRLTMGETFTIVGAILSGFAWRPTA